MSVSIVRKWYRNIPPSERDLPTVIVGNKAYTPNQVLKQVRKGTKLGQAMQDKIEYGMTAPMKLHQLAKKRVLAWLKNLPKGAGIFQVGGEEHSKQQLIQAVKQEKGVGKELIEEEKQIIKERMKV